MPGLVWHPAYLLITPTPCDARAANSMSRNKANLILKLTVSLLLIGYLGLHVEWREILDAFRETIASYYLFSTLLLFGLVCINSYKFFLLIKGTTINKSMWFLVKVNFTSRFYGLFLPSGLGRGVVRWYKVTKNKENRTLFLAVTLFERFVQVLLLLAVGFFPLFISPGVCFD